MCASSCYRSFFVWSLNNKIYLWRKAKFKCNFILNLLQWLLAVLYDFVCLYVYVYVSECKAWLLHIRDFHNDLSFWRFPVSFCFIFRTHSQKKRVACLSKVCQSKKKQVFIFYVGEFSGRLRIYKSFFEISLFEGKIWTLSNQIRLFLWKTFTMMKQQTIRKSRLRFPFQCLSVFALFQN
jgi:hypothetical protein